MKRRAALYTLALGLSAGCIGSLPGATGPRGPPEAPEGEPRTSADVLSIETWDFAETADGLLRIHGTVRNSGDGRATGTAAATVTVDGDEYTKSTEVTVSAGGTTEFELVFDVSYDEFRKNGSISLELA